MLHQPGYLQRHTDRIQLKGETVTHWPTRPVLSRTWSTASGASVVQVTPATSGFLYDCSEYNAQGRLIHMEDAGTQGGAVAMAPTLYEYDAFGNMTRETLALAGAARTGQQPPVREYAFSVGKRGGQRLITLWSRRGPATAQMDFVSLFYFENSNKNICISS